MHLRATDQNDPGSTRFAARYVSGNGNTTDTSKPQTGEYKDVPCVENRRSIAGRVVYAALNVQVSCNNPR